MALNIPALLDTVDTALDTFVFDVFTGIAEAAQGPATSMIALSITIAGIFIWLGYMRLTPGDVIKILFKIFAIWALITQWPMYSFWFVDLFTNTPGEVAGAMLSKANITMVDGSGISNSIGVIGYIDNLWEKFDQIAMKTAEGRSFLSEFFAFLIVSAAQILLLGYALILIILAKLALAVLLSLGSLFIIAVLFGFTSKLFDTWLQYLFNYMLLPILVFAIILVPLFLADVVLTDQLGMEEISSSDIGKLVFFSVLGFVLLLQAPTLAAGLAGGIAISTLNAVALAYRTGKGANNAERNFWNHRDSSFKTRGQRLRGAASSVGSSAMNGIRNLRSNKVVKT